MDFRLSHLWYLYTFYLKLPGRNSSSGSFSQAFSWHECELQLSAEPIVPSTTSCPFLMVPRSLTLLFCQAFLPSATRQSLQVPLRELSCTWGKSSSPPLHDLLLPCSSEFLLTYLTLGFPKAYNLSNARWVFSGVTKIPFCSSSNLQIWSIVPNQGVGMELIWKLMGN